MPAPQATRFDQFILQLPRTAAEDSPLSVEVEVSPDRGSGADRAGMTVRIRDGKKRLLTVRTAALSLEMLFPMLRRELRNVTEYLDLLESLVERAVESPTHLIANLDPNFGRRWRDDIHLGLRLAAIERYPDDSSGNFLGFALEHAIAAFGFFIEFLDIAAANHDGALSEVLTWYPPDLWFYVWNQSGVRERALRNAFIENVLYAKDDLLLTVLYAVGSLILYYETGARGSRNITPFRTLVQMDEEIPRQFPPERVADPFRGSDKESDGLRWVFGYADYVVSVSETLKRYLRRWWDYVTTRLPVEAAGKKDPRQYIESPQMEIDPRFEGGRFLVDPD